MLEYNCPSKLTPLTILLEGHPSSFCCSPSWRKARLSARSLLFFISPRCFKISRWQAAHLHGIVVPGTKPTATFHPDREMAPFSRACYHCPQNASLVLRTPEAGNIPKAAPQYPLLCLRVGDADLNYYQFLFGGSFAVK
ncbi:hypothetical protein AVEN_153464-1 [Araneus ventricosus]|uniref:Uncharacterized protein n=1 Tax=Araneus ventricosus TaxID=182803 RepID=A0A4Y2U0I5_ARAVE|nr:hypothetical protein AVEN_153464-1 [Araneus ventricosus]